MCVGGGGGEGGGGGGGGGQANRYSNALAKNIMQCLIGKHQKFAIYCRKPDVMNNVAYDWST